MKKFRVKTWSVLVWLAILLVSCGGGTGPVSTETGSDTGVETGTDYSANAGVLSLGLTDCSRDEYQAVYVTIDEVTVHRRDEREEGVRGDSWITVATPAKTYNLLELVNGVIETLGVTELESGRYTQMRLYLGSMPDDGVNIHRISAARGVGPGEFLPAAALNTENPKRIG